MLTVEQMAVVEKREDPQGKVSQSPDHIDPSYLQNYKQYDSSQY